MTIKQNFTDEEWQLLLDVPPMVGLAVMVAGKSGLGSMKEAWALSRGVLSAKDGYEGNELVHSLVDARLKDGEKSQVESLSNPYTGKSPEEILTEVQSMCQQVKSVLAEKSNEDEAAGFVDWAISVGERVANAAREGGLFDFSGERVSAEEAYVIEKVKKGFGVKKVASCELREASRENLSGWCRR